MPSRKNLKLTGVGLAVWGLAAMAFAADSDNSCPMGPALVKDMLHENLSIWERAADCQWRLIADDVGAQAITQFQDVARDNGLGGGLRTFARNGDFRLYVEGMSAMGLGATNAYLDKQPLAGTWRESSRGKSPDSTLLFAVGEVSLTKGGRYQYAQVWQFDQKVANWGMRMLVLRPMGNK
jgi:hypothetical protein